MEILEQPKADDRRAYWAETRFVPSVPHRGLSAPNWAAKRSGRSVKVSMPIRRAELDHDVRSAAEEAGCDCEMFWLMHPGDAQGCGLTANMVYVCQAQIESD
jgi:hypothetical protein